MDEDEKRKWRHGFFDPRPDPDILFVPGFNGCIYCRHPFKDAHEVTRCAMCGLDCHWPYCIKIHIMAFCERVRN